MTIREDIHAQPNGRQTRAEAVAVLRGLLRPGNVREALERDRAGGRTTEVSSEFAITETEFEAAVQEPEVRRMMDALEAEGVHVLVSDYQSSSSPKRCQAICIWLPTQS